MTLASSPVSFGYLSSPSQPPSDLARSQAVSALSATLSNDAVAHAGEMLRDRLLRFEQLVDEAFAESGALCCDLVQARKALGLSAVVGQPVFASITASIAALSEVRGQAVLTHKLLDKVGQALGFIDVDYGDGGKDPTGVDLRSPTADA